MAKIFTFLIVTILSISMQFAPAQEIFDIIVDGNAQNEMIITESGYQSFVVNQGFLDGANFTKVFGKNRPTTLWSDKRRKECYELSIRTIAQMPALSQENRLAIWGNYLEDLSIANDQVSTVISYLDLLNTNYVKANTIGGELSNEISKALRTINPKTIHGVKLKQSNLSELGKYLQVGGYALNAVDFAVGAAFQQALSGDIALSRLELLKNAIYKQKNSGINIDPVIFQALDKAEQSLTRNQDYWGAMVTEITDRRSEVISIGLDIVVDQITKDAIKLLTSYYSKTMGIKAAATQASTVAALWSISLMATYETIVALLDQHKQAQIAVTTATIALMLKNEVNNYQEPQKTTIDLLILQADYIYCDQMVKICTGVMQGFYDFVQNILFRNKPYEEVIKEYKQSRTSISEAMKTKSIKEFKYLSEIPEKIISESPAVLLILDNSGSMSGYLQNSQMDKLNAAKNSLYKILDMGNKNTKWGLIIYNSCHPELIQPFTTSKDEIKKAVQPLTPYQLTPIAQSLDRSLEIIDQSEEVKSCIVILLTDGMETCGGDPFQAALKYSEGTKLFKQLITQNNFSIFPYAVAQNRSKPVYLNVIGFTVTNSDSISLDLIAKSAGGSYYNADNVQELDRALKKALEPVMDDQIEKILLVLLLLVFLSAGVIGAIILKKKRVRYARY